MGVGLEMANDHRGSFGIDQIKSDEVESLMYLNAQLVGMILCLFGFLEH
jgi:hypothetical protein